jgi:DNA-binding response OmpR family regulator
VESVTKILVIEDEPLIRGDICELLGFEGYEVIDAADGIAGISLAAEQMPDLIICDIMMPLCDGYQVLDSVRSQPEISSTPFIFLTAKTDRASVREGMGLGADDYLTKPVTSEELLSAIRSRLERQALFRETSNRELEAQRREIMDVISNELRTPFISLLTMQELIARQIGYLSAEELANMLQTLRSGSQRLRHTVEQLVFAAQIEMGLLNETAIQEQGQRVQLWQITETAINLGRGFATRNRDAFIRLDTVDRSIDVWCHTDALRYSFAEVITGILNLIPKGAELVISQWQAENCAWLSMSEEYAGQSSNAVEQVMYAANSHVQNGDISSLSMGLPIASQIIRLHGGALELHAASSRREQLLVGLPLYPEQ